MHRDGASNMFRTLAKVDEFTEVNTLSTDDEIEYCCLSRMAAVKKIDVKTSLIFITVTLKFCYEKSGV